MTVHLPTVPSEGDIVDQLFHASSTTHIQTLNLFLILVFLASLCPQVAESDPQGSSQMESQGDGVQSPLHQSISEKSQPDEVGTEALEYSDHMDSSCQDETCDEPVRAHMGLKYCDYYINL